tara:strand:- start:5990 stop:7306 length:1317 start_codon:yes stop_codon:yes gene_type:complete
LTNIHKEKFNSIEFGQSCFYIGTLFLASTNFFAGVFYLIALIVSLTNKQIIFKRDIWNFSLLLFTLFLILSTSTIFINHNTSEVYELLKENSWIPSSVWLSLFNWIPLFLVFYFFQIYLRKENQRIKFAKCLFIGIFPVILSFFLQKLKIYGPFEYLNGLLVFYLKPIDDLGGLAGLFNNPNYAGIWLSASLPFCFLILKSYKYKKLKFYFTFTIVISIIYCILTTNSRNSFIGLIISTFYMLSAKYVIIGLLILGFLYLTIIQFTTISFFAKLGIQEFFPTTIFQKLLETNYLSKLQFSRIDIWAKAINLISERPIFGWGAATFPILYIMRGGIEKAQHTHNMPMEIAQNHGIPAAFIIVFFVSFLFFKAWKIIFIKNKLSDNYINKAWITSLLIIIVSHLSDVTYYDGRISLLIWILLAGLKCILDEDKIKISKQI